MKNKIIQKLLKLMAKSVLRKRKPTVVAITGSVGKTTAKEAISKVLSSNFKTRSSAKNYNNEIGVTLTILGCQIDYNRGKILQIFGIFYYWFQALFFDKNYPEILILEMGADKPGDIKYFCDFIPITVGVLTDIGISHLENFKTKQILATEKGYLLRNVIDKGMAIYNWDNKTVREIGQKLSVNTIGYGLEEEAEMKATDIIFKVEANHKVQKIDGINFKLNYQDKVLPVRLEKSISKGSIYGVLAAFAVGKYFDLNLVEMAESVNCINFYQSRMALLKGLNESFIIDDSYNSAPDSVKMAIESLDKVEAKRKLIVLGDMLELGIQEEKAHRKIGKLINSKKFDLLVTVGDRMKWTQEESKKLNSGKTVHFDNPIKAGFFVKKELKKGDIVLVKGSQGMRMEKIVEEIMFEPEKRGKLIVRQDESWKNIPYKKP